MDTPKTITHLGLCAGYGGIELGLHRVLGNLRSVALCEIEAFACANLVAKMEAGLLDPAPIWTDLKTFPWAEFRDRVDILTGGYPCQPFSAAGKRLGTEDPRHLWPFIASGIRILRPKLCYFENVEGHISLGLREVLGDLGAAGYTAAWGIFSASEVGAPHQRKRVFILAYDQRQRIEELHRIVAMGPQQHPAGDISSGWRRVSFAADCNGYDEETGELGSECSICGCDYTEDCECPGPTQDGYEYAEFDGVLYARPEQAWPSRPGEPQHECEPPRVVGTRVAHSNELRLEEHGLQHAGVSFGSGRGQDAEAMDNTASLSHSCTQPRSGEERYGKGESNYLETSESRKTQPPLGGDADGPAGGLGYAELQVSCDNRTDELRLLGNGVVPATAERAFLTLWEELFQQQPTN